MPFQTLASMGQNFRGPQIPNQFTGQGAPPQGQPMQRPWNDPNNWGGHGAFGGPAPGGGLGIGAPPAPVGNPPFSGPVGFGGAPAPVGNPPFSGPFPIQTGMPPAPSGGLGANPNPPTGVPIGMNPTPYNGAPAPVVAPVQQQQPVLGSFDSLKGKKTIKRGGLYKLKAGESVHGVTSLASLRHAR